MARAFFLCVCSYPWYGGGNSAKKRSPEEVFDICRMVRWGLRAPCRTLSRYTRHNGAPAARPETSYTSNMPMVEQRLSPEYVDGRGKSWVTASKAKLAGLTMTMNWLRYGHEDCEIIVPTFTMESGRRCQKRVCGSIGKFLRKKIRQGYTACLQCPNYPALWHHIYSAEFRVGCLWHNLRQPTTTRDCSWMFQKKIASCRT